MKILSTITSYPPATGGAQLHLHTLLTHLVPHDEVRVVSQWDTNRTDWLLGSTLRSPGEPRTYEIDGIRVHRMAIPFDDRMRMAPCVGLYYFAMPWCTPHIAKYFARQLRPHVADCDIMHNVRIGRENLTYASQMIAREADIPFVFTPLHHPRWVGWRYQVYLDIYRSADAVITLTNAEKNILQQLGVQEERIHVTGNGPVVAEQADPQRFRSKLGTESPFVLFLGQHYDYKGYQELLASMDVVWQSNPDTHFVFIGPAVGASEKVYAQYEDARVHRLGTVDLQTKTDALAACDLLCVPSTQESFGGIYVEAWNYGKPVIGCNIPAVADVVTNEVDGLLVQQRPDEIADAIRMLLSDSALAAQMGAMGHIKAMERYSWDSLAAKTRQVYRSVME